MFRSKLIAASLALAWGASAQELKTTAVPPELQVPAGHIAFLKTQAAGTQNYVCLPSAAGLAWRFQGPQATLFVSFRWGGGEVRHQVMTHFLSPSASEEGTPARATWQSSLDTSAVWAQRIAESNDPAYVAPGAIPWFLLQATGARRGPANGAQLVAVTYLQRVNTTGGLAPAGACSEAGAIAFVPYTADYVFYRAAAGR